MSYLPPRIVHPLLDLQYIQHGFFTRLGVFGEASWGRLLRAMRAHFALWLVSPSARTRR